MKKPILEYRKRIVVVSNIIDSLYQIQNAVNEKFPDYETGVCKEMGYLEDVFYGIRRQRVRPMEEGGLTQAYNPNKRKKRTLPIAMIHNGKIKTHEDDDPYSHTTIDARGHIRKLCFSNRVPMIEYAETPLKGNKSINIIETSELERIMGELREITEAVK